MKILAISGSLRKDSFNTSALRAAQKLAPAGISISIADISQIPLYNEDMRAGSEHAAVAALKAEIRAADALLIATPEYSFSMPGVLKNTLDWLARPPEPPFVGKVVAILGATTSMVGTARAQYHLRQVLTSMNTFTVNKPEVFIREAPTKFNAQHELTDEATAKLIVELLGALQTLKARLG
jgi:chromate reductase, NAD(P)H dehydrogenase (quinone)